jgi:DNA-binding CsgD family transcriptional regulator
MEFQLKIPEVVELVAIMEQWSDRGCAIGLCFTRGYPTFHHFSYAPEFLRRYEAEDLAKSDQTLVRGFTEDGIFRWSDLETEVGASKTMEIAKTFGMADGICFSETINGLKSIASISLTETAKANAVPTALILQKLQLAALAVSKHVSLPSMTHQSTEYLALVARGLSDEDIAKELDMSLSGTRRRRKNAILQIGAKTLPQALGLAASLGLIKVYQNV